MHFPALLRSAPSYHIEPIVIAASPALDVLEARGIEVTHRFETPPVEASDTDEAEVLIAEARGWFDRFEPDAVLTGISGPWAGVGEAMAIVADGRAPVLAIQDWWGFTNRRLGGQPAEYLVADDLAARVTATHSDVPCTIVGYPKYEDYDDFDRDAARATARREFGVDEATPLVIVAGQPLWGRAGYEATLRYAATHLHAPNDVPIEFAYIPHPKERTPDVQRGAEALGGESGHARLWRPDRIETALAACDVLLTCYSTCAYDLAYLNARSGLPQVGVFMLWEPDVVEAYREASGNLYPPPHTGSGMVLMPSFDDFEQTLAAALDPVQRGVLASRARAATPPTEGASDRVWEAVRRRVARVHA